MLDCDWSSDVCSSDLAYSLMNVLQIMPPQPLPVEAETAPVALPPVAPQNGLIPWLRAKLGI
jgi:hypothetical protein